MMLWGRLAVLVAVASLSTLGGEGARGSSVLTVAGQTPIEWGDVAFTYGTDRVPENNLKVEIDWAVFAPDTLITAGMLPSDFEGYNSNDALHKNASGNNAPIFRLYGASGLLANGAIQPRDFIYAFQVKVLTDGPVNQFNVAFADTSVTVGDLPTVHGYGYISNDNFVAPDLNGMRLEPDLHSVESLFLLNNIYAGSTSDVLWISSPDTPGSATANVLFSQGLSGVGSQDETVGGPVVVTLPHILPQGAVVVPLPAAAPVIALGLVGLIGRRVWRGRRKVVAVVGR